MKKAISVLFTLVLVTGLLILSATAQDLPKVINGGVLNGKATSLPTPSYPADAKAEGVEGKVWVEVEIDESGTVISAVASTETRKVPRQVEGQVLEVEVPLADARLREAAEDAARQVRFSPTLLNGQPVRVIGTIIYNFVSKESADVSVKWQHDGSLTTTAISLPNAPYPAAARAVRGCGPVAVRVNLDRDGNVTSAAALSGHPLLRAAAVEAAKAAKFRPVSTDTEENLSGVLTYNFALADGGGCSK